MNDLENAKFEIKELLESQPLGVLATQNRGQPYTSIVAFSSSDDLRSLFFVILTPCCFSELPTIRTPHEIYRTFNSNKSSLNLAECSIGQGFRAHIFGIPEEGSSTLPSAIDRF